MLRVNIGQMQTCVTENPKIAQASWKIWNDIPQKRPLFWFEKKNNREKRHQDFSHQKTKNRPNILIDFSSSKYMDQWVRGCHEESCHLETERVYYSIKVKNQKFWIPKMIMDDFSRKKRCSMFSFYL